MQLSQLVALQAGTTYYVTLEASQPDLTTQCSVTVFVGDTEVLSARPGKEVTTYGASYRATQDAKAEPIRVVAGGCGGVEGKNTVMTVEGLSVQKV